MRVILRTDLEKFFSFIWPLQMSKEEKKQAAATRAASIFNTFNDRIQAFIENPSEGEAKTLLSKWLDIGGLTSLESGLRALFAPYAKGYKAPVKKPSAGGKAKGAAPKARKPRAKKAPGSPKRTRSAYILYSMVNRADVTAELAAELGGEKPSPKDVVRKLGADWKELSADEQQTYKDASKVDSDLYKAEEAEFKESGEYTEVDRSLSALGL